ncbi:Ig-like domain-containing protein, partial [Pseudomonas sp. SIMBA_059]
GTAEAGTTITVRDPNNNVVGTVEVGANGQFTVPINPPQNNGQLLTVVSTDDAGNASVIVPYQTNDTSPPGVVTDMAIN